MKHIMLFILVAHLVLPKAWGQCPTVDAGPDIIQCSSKVFELNATVSNAEGVHWTTSNNSGVFAPNQTTPNATYAMTPVEDETGDYSKLVIAATKNGCPDTHDTMYVFYNPAIIVRNGFSPGNPNIPPTFDKSISVCSDVISIDVYGTIYLGMPGAGTSDGPLPIKWIDTGLWSTAGTGTFADPHSVNTTYTFSSEDVQAGTLKLWLTSTGMGDCENKSDSITITIETCMDNDEAKEGIMAQVYPNPAKENITVAAVGTFGVNFLIYSLQGQLVVEEKIISGSANLDISSLPDGVYIYKLLSGEKVSTGKLIKE